MAIESDQPVEADIEILVEQVDNRIDISKRWISEKLDGGLFTFVKEINHIAYNISELKHISNCVSGKFKDYLDLRISVYEDDLAYLREQHILLLKDSPPSQRAFQQHVFMHHDYWQRARDGYSSGILYLLIAHGTGIAASLTAATTLWGHPEAVGLTATACFLFGIGIALCATAISMSISIDNVYTSYYCALVDSKITSRTDDLNLPERKINILWLIHVYCLIGSLLVLLVCVLWGSQMIARLAGDSLAFLKWL